MELARCLLSMWLILKLLQTRRQASRRHRVRLFLQKQLKRNYMLLSVILSSLSLYQSSIIVDRRLWVKQRNSDWWDRVVVQFDDEEWRENFRMSRALFNYLCSELREHI